MLWVRYPKPISNYSGHFRPFPAEFQFFSISKNALFQWFTNRKNPHSWVDFASFNTRISTKFFNPQLEWLHSLFYTKSMSCCVCVIGGASQTHSNVFFRCFSRCSTSGWNSSKLSENCTSASWQSWLRWVDVLFEVLIQTNIENRPFSHTAF